MIQPERSSQRTEGPKAWLAAALLALSVAVVYGPSLAVPLIIDDRTSILGNESITSLWPLLGTDARPGPLRPPQDVPTSARPLVNLSFAVNYFIGGTNPTGYHAVNAILHFLSAVLLLAIVRRTLSLPYFANRFETSVGWLALAAALIWALHPLATEAVIYATQRTELMMALFYLATLYCSLRYWSTIPLSLREGPGEGSTPSRKARKQTEKQPSRPNKRTPTIGSQTHDTNRRARTAWLILAVVSCAAGMASKEVMVSAPIVILLFDRTFVAGSLAKAIRRSWPLYAALASTWILLLFLSLGQPHLGSAGFGLVPLNQWWLTQSKILWMYLKLAIGPSPLLIHYLPPYLTSFGEAWMYVLPLLLIGTITLVLLWRNRPLGFLATCVFAVLAPTSLVPIPLEIAAERRMYLALAAIAAAIVVGSYQAVQRLLERTPSNAALAICSMLVAIVLGIASVQRLDVYQSEIRLWQDVLKSHPEDYIAHEELGSFLVLSGRIPEGVEHIQTALALKPDNPDALNSLGFALMNSGHVAEAIEKFQAALTQKPDFPRALNNYGAALGMSGRFSDAIDPLKHALRLAPAFADARVNLGNTLIQIGQLSEAVDELEAAVELRPDDSPTLYNLALALARLNRSSQAIACFDRVLKLEPNNADAHFQLAQLFRQSAQPEQAIEHYQAVVRLKPNEVMAYASMAQTLANANRPNDAIAMAEKAIQVAAITDQPATGKQINDWLTKYKASLQNGPGRSAPTSSPTSNVESKQP